MTLRVIRWLRGRIAELLGGVDANTKKMMDERIAKNREEVMKSVDERLDAQEKRLAEISGRITSAREEILKTLTQKMAEQNRDDENRIIELRNALAEEKHQVENLIEREELLVSQKSSLDRPIDISSLGNKRNVKMKGEFQVSGESRSDLKFYVFDEFNFEKFVHKQPFHAMDESPNVSRYSFTIPITHSGRYYLFFDNTSSTFSPKKVTLSAQLEYESRSL